MLVLESTEIVCSAHEVRIDGIGLSLNLLGELFLFTELG
jgi:hypothetical protein